MSGHIVGAFVVVHIIGVIFFHGFVKECFKILPHRRVRIFVDGKGRGSMPDKYLAHTCFQFAQLRQRAYHFVRNEVKTAFLFLQPYQYLVDLHTANIKKEAVLTDGPISYDNHYSKPLINFLQTCGLCWAQQTVWQDEAGLQDAIHSAAPVAAQQCRSSRDTQTTAYYCRFRKRGEEQAKKTLLEYAEPGRRKKFFIGVYG